MPRTNLERALYTVTTAKMALRTSLNRIADDAARAVAALDAGQLPFSTISSAGPLGHQAPFDVAIQYNQLKGALDVAYALGATDEQMQAALLGPASD